MREGKTVFHKVWYFLRTYILTLARFDLFLQGALLIVIILQTNAYLLLRRDAGTGYIPALLEDWVMLGAAGAEVLLGAFIGWYGRKWRNFALSGWLAASAASGLIVLAFPYAYSNPVSVELCGGETISGYLEPTTDPLAVPRQVMLIITVVLCSLTQVSIWAHGMTYLDDHEPQNGPYFYGILISIRLSLGLNCQDWLRPSSVRDDWWEAQISVSMLTLMFAILFTLFPRKMPQHKEVEVSVTENGFTGSISHLVRNKPLVVQILGLSLLHAAIFGFVRYDDSFVQARFQVEVMREDPQTSQTFTNIFRSLVIIFFVMIFRVRFSVRRSDGVKANTASRVGGVLAVFVAVFFAVMAIIFCSSEDISGVEGGVYEQPVCSMGCGCSSESYGFSPVCGLDSSTTYFSPCNAGCQEYENLNGFLLFYNCTCGGARAARGSCSLQSCRTAFSVYQLFFTITLAVAAAAFVMQGMVVLRSVRGNEKPLATGFSFAIVALLSHVLGHLLYMMISRWTCAYEGNGNTMCLFHRPTLWSMAATSSGLSLLSAVVSIVASKVERDDLYHDS